MTSAQRTNARHDKIWAKTKAIEKAKSPAYTSKEPSFASKVKHEEGRLMKLGNKVNK